MKYRLQYNPKSIYWLSLGSGTAATGPSPAFGQLFNNLVVYPLDCAPWYQGALQSALVAVCFVVQFRTVKERDKTMSNETIYNEVTAQIVAALENSAVQTGQWESPFKQLVQNGFPINASTDKEYSGINILNLWACQQNGGFASNQWATFKQWKALGFSVQKGQKSIAKVIFYKQLSIEDKDTGEQKKIPIIKNFAVFNRDQTDAPAIAPRVIEPTIGKIDQGFLDWVESTGANIQSVEQNKAYYRPSTDSINMPALDNIKTIDSYQSTLAHELVHWTGHRSRLDRLNGVSKSDYAFEELIAELGAAFVCARLGISQSEHANHVAYLQSWLEALKNDNRYIFKASAQAQKACDYLNPQ